MAPTAGQQLPQRQDRPLAPAHQSSIHKEVVAHLGAGGAIEFTIATAVVLADGQAADVRLKSARRLAENAAVLTAQMESGVSVLNVDADLPEADEAGGEEEA